jgi:tail assembly protein
MANAISLDDIRASAEAKYGSTDITLSDGTLTRLLNPLRMPKAKRTALGTLQDKLDEDGVDQEAVLREALTLVASSPARAQALLDEIGDDLAMLATVFETYSRGAQVGEASPSPA